MKVWIKGIRSHDYLSTRESLFVRTRSRMFPREPGFLESRVACMFFWIKKKKSSGMLQKSSASRWEFKEQPRSQSMFGKLKSPVTTRLARSVLEYYTRMSLTYTRNYSSVQGGLWKAQKRKHMVGLGRISRAINSVSTSKSFLWIQAAWSLTALRTPPPHRLLLSTGCFYPSVQIISLKLVLAI